jgi:hypothetical protein
MLLLNYSCDRLFDWFLGFFQSLHL